MRLTWPCLFLVGCSASVLDPTLGAEERVVPGPGLPAEVEPQAANNNLDVIRHDGRVYLAFRTAPSHFASEAVVMYVVSSTDERSWTYETKIELGTDVREPRFLSWDGELHLYFAVLGSNPLDFEPGEMRRITKGRDGAWSATPEKAYLDGFIPWRIKLVDGVPHMIGYVGGENIYDFMESSIDTHWLRSSDGRNWTAARGDDPVVARGGGSETDYVVRDGEVIAVMRNELGDDSGHGAKICRDWACEHDPKKYDSPLVFAHGDHIVLVGRRSTANRGRYDLARDDLPFERETGFYLGKWSETPKRCALWEVDPETLEVSFLVDLPSNGDTCFASVLENEDGSYTLYNYTSPLDDPEISWLAAQLGPTRIYRIRVEL